MSLESAGAFSGLGFPESKCVVVGPAEHHAATGMKTATADDVSMAGQCSGLVLLGDGGQTDVSVPGGRHQPLPVRREANGRDRSCVANNLSLESMILSVPL